MADKDSLAERIRDEANIAARPGQYARLMQIASDVEDLQAEKDHLQELANGE